MNNWGKGNIHSYFATSLFILLSLRILKEDGFLTYIVPNTLLRATVYDVVRKYLLDNSKILTIADLSAGAFKNITASTIILIIQNSDLKNAESTVQILNDIQGTHFANQQYVDQGKFLNNISYTFNIFSDNQTDNLIKNIGRDSERLDKYFDVFAGGIATGPGKGKYIANSKLTNQYKPLIEGKDIKKYSLQFKNRYILYDRGKLYRARDENIFLSPEKLVTQRIGGGENPLIVGYDNKQYYTFNSTNSILPKRDNNHLNLKYLLAILNSRLLNWYYTIQFTNNSTLTVNISKTFLEQLPIKEVFVKDQGQFVTLVNNILSITDSSDYFTNSEKRARVKDYEKQIDLLVYKLYGLSPEEIEVVEGTKLSSAS